MNKIELPEFKVLRIEDCKGFEPGQLVDLDKAIDNIHIKCGVPKELLEGRDTNERNAK